MALCTSYELSPQVMVRSLYSEEASKLFRCKFNRWHEDRVTGTYFLTEFATAMEGALAVLPILAVSWRIGKEVRGGGNWKLYTSETAKWK